MEIYVVQPQNTLAQIARQFGVRPESILENNQLQRPDELVVGQALLILTPEDARAPKPFGVLETGGYAYPFTNEGVLLQAMPYLTRLLSFSYGFTTTGELIAPEDENLLALAAEYGAEPILVLTPFTGSGTFNNQLVNLVVENQEIQNRLIEQLLREMSEKGFLGVDIDFEYILPEDRDAYTAFIANLHERLSPYGYRVSVALAPKTSTEQRGLLYEGIDYGGIGAAADAVLLMTYEWGYTYGPPMAVAPLPSVRRVLEYAVTQIPVGKIHMGIPNYGYDWPLPYVSGNTRAVTIGNEQAIEIARENGARIEYDASAQAPFFSYTRDGIAHVVGFEDVRSIYAKLQTVEEYGFAGVGYWNLLRPFQANWLLLNRLFDII